MGIGQALLVDAWLVSVFAPPDVSLRINTLVGMDNFLRERRRPHCLRRRVPVLQLLRNATRGAGHAGTLWRGLSRIQEQSPALVWKSSRLISRRCRNEKTASQ